MVQEYVTDFTTPVKALIFISYLETTNGFSRLLYFLIQR